MSVLRRLEDPLFCRRKYGYPGKSTHQQKSRLSTLTQFMFPHMHGRHGGQQALYKEKCLRPVLDIRQQDSEQRRSCGDSQGKSLELGRQVILWKRSGHNLEWSQPEDASSQQNPTSNDLEWAGERKSGLSYTSSLEAEIGKDVYQLKVLERA